MWSPIGWLKSRNEWCDLSIGLYIDLAPLYIKYAEKLQKKWFDFINSLANIIPENVVKVSKIKCFKQNKRMNGYSLIAIQLFGEFVNGI